MTHTPLSLPGYPGDHHIINRLEQTQTSLYCEVWEEPALCIVLGKGCRLEQEVQREVIETQTIPIYRREGGGGTVVLSPGMLVIAIAAHVKEQYGTKRFFTLLQQPIIETLESYGMQDVSQRGLSDLAWKDRKILGSSLRRQRSLLLYQGVLLVDVDRSMLSNYLCHPPKEPDYRQGRSHENFTISLREIGFEVSVGEFQATLQSRLRERLWVLLADDLDNFSVT